MPGVARGIRGPVSCAPDHDQGDLVPRDAVRHAGAVPHVVLVRVPRQDEVDGELLLRGQDLHHLHARGAVLAAWAPVGPAVARAAGVGVQRVARVARVDVAHDHLPLQGVRRQGALEPLELAAARVHAVLRAHDDDADVGQVERVGHVPPREGRRVVGPRAGPALVGVHAGVAAPLPVAREVDPAAPVAGHGEPEGVGRAALAPRVGAPLVVPHRGHPGQLGRDAADLVTVVVPEAVVVRGVGEVTDVDDRVEGRGHLGEDLLHPAGARAVVPREAPPMRAVEVDAHVPKHGVPHRLGFRAEGERALEESFGGGARKPRCRGRIVYDLVSVLARAHLRHLSHV
mmetsp:Transcript_124843/g.353359  ORF Transcript_124843/g.353359 Transcript_124843/m.353359 type:complete len:343 (-) Transcript_124843:190-1218(-)